MEFVPQLQTYRPALTYDVRLMNHVVAIQRVVKMVKRSPEVDAFIEKARGVIINS